MSLATHLVLIHPYPVIHQAIQANHFHKANRHTLAVTRPVDRAPYRVIRASPADQVGQAPANRIQASRNPVSLNQVNQIRIRRAAANPIQATQATASRTVLATLVHLVAVIPARAIRATATTASPIVQKVNRLVRKATANLKASRILKTRAVIATRYRVIRGQATRSPVIPVEADLRLPAFPAKATANRRASRKVNPNPKVNPKANQSVNHVRKANHPAVMDRTADPVAIGQVTAKATVFPGRPVSSTSEPCNSTWIWSCGWQLLESDCPEVGEPPSGSGGFDGEVVEVAA